MTFLYIVSIKGTTNLDYFNDMFLIFVNNLSKSMNYNKKTLNLKLKIRISQTKSIYKYIQTLQSFVRIKSVISLQKVNINTINQNFKFYLISIIPVLYWAIFNNARKTIIFLSKRIWWVNCYNIILVVTRFLIGWILFISNKTNIKFKTYQSTCLYVWHLYKLMSF